MPGRAAARRARHARRRRAIASAIRARSAKCARLRSALSAHQPSIILGVASRGHSDPPAACGARRSCSRPALTARVADRRSAHAGSRRAGIPRRRFRQVGFAVWDCTGTRGTTCRATACCSRRSERCSACAPWARCRCSPRAACSSAWRARVLRRARRAGARCGSRCAPLGDVWIGRLTFALGVAFALAAVLALQREHPLAAGVLAARVRGGEPGRRRAARAGRADARARAPLAAGAADRSRRRPRWSCCRWRAVPGRRLRAVSADVVRRDGVRGRAVPVGAAARRSGCCASGPACTCWPVSCACWCTRRWAATSSATGCCWRGRCCCARCCAAPLRREAARTRGGGSAPGGARCGASRACIALWDAVGAGARDDRGCGQRLRRARPTTLPVEHFLTAPRARPGAGRGAADALALGGGAARAERVAGARVGEAARQRYDRVLLAPGLSAAGYERWLHDQAVAYVALPDAPLDPSSAAEGTADPRRPAIPARGLRERALADIRGARRDAARAGPGRLLSLGHDSFASPRRRPDDFEVRVHFTRFWTLDAGAWMRRARSGRLDACAAHAPGHRCRRCSLLACARASGLRRSVLIVCR